MTKTSRVLALGVALGLALSACASGGPGLEIGFQRIALDLAFKDEDLAEPLPEREVIRLVLPDEFADSIPPVIRRVQAPQAPCPAAPPGLTPEQPAFAAVVGEPQPGKYTRRNTGAIELELATGQGITLPVPPRSTVEVSPTESYYGLAATGERTEPLPTPETDVDTDPSADLWEFSMTRKLLPGYSVTDTYRYTNDQRTPLEVDPEVDNELNTGRDTALGDYLHLVKRVTVSDGVEKVFTPTPPIRLLRLNVPEGTVVTSGVVHGGIDRESRVAMTVRSQILSREVVDVCGDVLDTYRVEIQEQFADLAATPPESSGNEPGTSTIWNIAFDRGLLLVREIVDTTLRTTIEIAGAPVPVIVRFKYTSTLTSPNPEPA